MLGVEDWAEIRRLRKAEKMPIKAIARVMGCSKNTVKKALGADGPPAYHRLGRGRWWMRWSRGFGSCCRRRR